MAKMYGKGKTAIESEEQQKRRWQIELEFVQCLSNPNYLNFLAQRGYFKDQSFINYLKYLQYWKEPDYAKYLMYPMCLYFLDLLQYEHFRREIVNSQCCKFIDDQAILQWQHYTRKRIKMMNSINENVPTVSTAQHQQQANGGMAGAAISGVLEGATANTGTESTPQQQQQQQAGLQNGSTSQGQASAQQQQQPLQREQTQTATQQQQQQQQQINGLAAAGSIKLEIN